GSKKDMNVVQLGFLLNYLHPKLFSDTKVYFFQT
ncbi:MAG: hypothetical protein PWQ91_1030, partial [Eubacteriales bacterium]|nr:hypothetical protein [Eubacteriales bacterium]